MKVIRFILFFALLVAYLVYNEGVEDSKIVDREVSWLLDILMTDRGETMRMLVGVLLTLPVVSSAVEVIKAPVKVVLKSLDIE